MPAMPAVLVDAFKRHRAERVDITDDDKIPEGGRDNYLASIAGTMRRRGLNRREIEVALRELNKRCDPPLDERDIERIAASVAQYVPDDAYLTALAKGEAEIQIVDDDMPASMVFDRAGIRFIDVREILEQPPPEYDWLWTDFIERGELVWLAGPGKVGKSMLALFLGLASLGGRREFLGHDLSEMPALVYLDCENREKTVARRLHLAGVPVPLADRIRYGVLRGTNLGSEEGLTALDVATRDVPGSLLVLDSLVGMHRSDEDKATEVRQFVIGIRQVAEKNGLTVIGLAHENRGGNIRGSLDWINAVDGVLSLGEESGGEGEPTFRRITAKHTRDSEGGTTVDFDFRVRDVEGRRQLTLRCLTEPEVEPEQPRQGQPEGTVLANAERIAAALRDDPEISPGLLNERLKIGAAGFRLAVRESDDPLVRAWGAGHGLEVRP